MARNCGITFMNMFCSATIRPLVVRPIRIFGSVVELLCYSSACFHTVDSVEPLSFLDTLSSVFMVAQPEMDTTSVTRYTVVTCVSDAQLTKRHLK
jgi:hypothetical protein